LLLDRNHFRDFLLLALLVALVSVLRFERLEQGLLRCAEVLRVLEQRLPGTTCRSLDRPTAHRGQSRVDPLGVRRLLSCCQHTIDVELRHSRGRIPVSLADQTAIFIVVLFALLLPLAVTTRREQLAGVSFSRRLSNRLCYVLNRGERTGELLGLQRDTINVMLALPLLQLLLRAEDTLLQ